MILTLKVTGSDAPDAVNAAENTFLESGGTIGRAPNPQGRNHWMLRHDAISRLHARISYADGAFYITDPPPGSSNGIFLNGSGARLEIGRAYRLRNGDSLYMQPFTIRAEISGREADSGISSTESTGGLTGVLDRKRAPRKNADVPNAAKINQVPIDREHVPVSPLIRTGKSKEPSSLPNIPKNYNPDDDSGDLSDSVEDVPVPRYDPPTPTPGASRNPNSKASDTPHREPVDLRPSRESDPLSDSLAAMLAGAGLSSVRVTPEVARNIGEIFRTVVRGVLVVLKARQKTKSEFSLTQTEYRTTKNNPLKFSVNVDDALHNLFVKRNAAFLGPVEAFDDAFKDLRNHQLATLAGVRAAFDAMLAEFKPDHLEARFERRLAGPLVAHTGKFRYWTLYREHYAELVKDADEAFDHLFAEQFARAYEQQLERLKVDDGGES